MQDPTWQYLFPLLSILHSYANGASFESFNEPETIVEDKRILKLIFLYISSYYFRVFSATLPIFSFFSLTYPLTGEDLQRLRIRRRS